MIDGPDKLAGNHVTQAEFDQLAEVYERIEDNKGDLRLQMHGSDREKALEDVARILETQSGRDMLTKLSDNQSKQLKDGSHNPRHMTTYLDMADPGSGGEVSNFGEPAFDKGMTAGIARERPCGLRA